MKYSVIFTALSVVSTAFALPAKRDNGVSDVDVLNFALTLEQLESAFYTQGLAKYSEDDFVNAGLPTWARGRLTEVAAHEATHVSFLSSALGSSAVAPCQYAFPDTDPVSFVAIAEALETVGSSAYTGAAALISNKDYLTAAASILSIEGRHAAWINSAVRKLNPWSTAFEIVLDLDQVYTMASAFITSCPSSNPALPVKAFPTLTVPASARPNTLVTLDFDSSSAGSSVLYAAFLTGTGTQYSLINDQKQAMIPDGLMGTVYVIITTSNTDTTDANTVAGPAMVSFSFNSDGVVLA